MASDTLQAVMALRAQANRMAQASFTCNTRSQQVHTHPGGRDVPYAAEFMRTWSSTQAGVSAQQPHDPNEPPEEFVCPISLEIMKDPVVLTSGETYERKAIEAWFASGKEYCPMTMRPVDPQQLTPNRILRTQILEWREQRHKPKQAARNPFLTRSNSAVSCAPRDPGLNHKSLLFSSMSLQLRNRVPVSVHENKSKCFSSPLPAHPGRLPGQRDPTGTATSSQAPTKRIDPAVLLKFQVDPSTFAKALSGKNDCDARILAAESVAELAKEGYAPQLLRSNIIPPLAKFLRCEHLHCQAAALLAILPLLRSCPSSEDSNAYGDSDQKPSMLRMMLSRRSSNYYVHSFGEDGQGVKYLMRILNNSASPRKLEALDVLRELAVRDCTLRAFAKNEVVLRLAHLLQSANDPVFKAKTVAALLPFLFNDTIGTQTVASKNIDELTRALYANDLAVAASAVTVLARLAKHNDTLRNAIVNASCIHALPDLLVAGTVAPVLELILQLIPGTDAAYQLKKSGVLPALVKLLQSAVTEHRTAAAHVLGELTAAIPQFKVIIAAERALPLLGAMLESDDAGGQTAAAATILELVRDCPENQEAARAARLHLKLQEVVLGDCSASRTAAHMASKYLL